MWEAGSLFHVALLLSRENLPAVCIGLERRNWHPTNPGDKEKFSEKCMQRHVLFSSNVKSSDRTWTTVKSSKLSGEGNHHLWLTSIIYIHK